MALNDELLFHLGGLFRDAGAGTLRLDAGSVQRTLHIHHGELVGTDSNVRGERLGSLAVTTGRVSTEVVEAVAQKAREAKTLLGDTLVGLGCMGATDLAELLELQVQVRFTQCLGMTCGVQVSALGQHPGAHYGSIGQLVLTAFRSTISKNAQEALVLALQGRTLT